MTKSYFYSICASVALAATPLYFSACSSGADTEQSTSGGVTANEFAGGGAAFSVHGGTVFTVRPLSSTSKVDPNATLVTGVEGVLEVDTVTVPVYFTYSTLGDLATTGVVAGEITVTLQSTEFADNSSLSSALGAPNDGTFLDCKIQINYLSGTMTVVTRTVQPSSFDPDVPGTGDLVTGVGQTQTSYLNNVRFFYAQ